MNLRWKTLIRPGFEFLLIAFLLVFSSLLVLQPINPMSMELGRDAGAFAYIGNQVVHGRIPYLDVWDSKPPGIFLINALGLMLIKESRWGIWLVEYFFLLSSSLLGFVGLRKKYGPTAALAATFVWQCGLSQTLTDGNFTEEYSLLFGFLSMFLFVWSMENEKTLWADIGIGISLGSSFLFRLNNIGPEIAILVVLFISMVTRREFRLWIRLVTIGITALIPITILAAVYLSPNQAFTAFWEASFIYNLAYSGNHFNAISSLGHGLAYIGFASGIALLGVLSAWLEIGHKIQRHEEPDQITLWIALVAVIEVILSGLSGRNYDHYFINWMPMIAFASALIISRSFSEFLKKIDKIPWIPLGLSLIILFACFNKVPFDFYSDIAPLLSNAKVTERIDQVSKYITMKTREDQTVLAWGSQVSINFLSKRESPTPYLFYPLYEPSEITDRISKDFYYKLTSNPPAYIVDGTYNSNNSVIPLDQPDPRNWLSEHGVYNTPYLLETLDFIQKNYVLVRTINNVDVYRFIQQ